MFVICCDDQCSPSNAAPVEHRIVDMALERVRRSATRRIIGTQHPLTETLAEITELYRTYVGQIERGDVTPTLDAAERKAHALGLELWEALHPNFSLDAVIKQVR